MSNANPSDDGRSQDLRVVNPASSPNVLLDPYRRYDALGAANAIDGEDGWATVRDFLRVFLGRKWLIFSIAIAVVALGGLRTLMTQPMYTSTVRLQIDTAVAKIVESGSISPTNGGEGEDYLRTQYALLQGREMAVRVASALKLSDDPDFFKPSGISIFGVLRNLIKPAPAASSRRSKSDLEEAAAGVIMGRRAVQPLPGSRLVDISYSDPSPARAQRIAEGYGTAFIASTLDKRFEANSYAKTFLDDQIKQLKIRLEDSEQALLNFAEKEQIVGADDKSSIAESNLAAANATLGGLISERIKNEEQWKQAENAAAVNLPQLLSNPVVENLRTERNVLATDYQEKLQIYKPDYPGMVQISKKIKEIDRQLASEVQTIKGSLKAAYESSLKQEDELKTRIAGLQVEVLDLQKRSIQYNILKREVDTNRELYNSLLQRYKEVDIASGAGTNNVFVVEKADLPGGPSSPDMSRALFYSLLWGLCIGLATAFVLDRLDDTIKTPEDGERISGLVTLGIIPRSVATASAEEELADPRSGIAEAYRSLCTALQFSTDNGLPKTLLVTSSGPAEGKSITSLAVSRHFANLGMKVLLIDADLRRPSLHTKVGLDNSAGLSTYLTGGSQPPELLQRTAIPNLALMASGPLPPNAADLLGSARLQSLLTIGLEVFDLVVIDGPPVLGLADSLILSSAASAAMFVIGAGDTRTAAVRGSRSRDCSLDGRR